MADLGVFPDISRVLISEEQLQQTVRRIAQEINAAYAGSNKPLLMVGILKGSVVFMADLMRHITVPMSIDFMQASSYGSNTVSCGNVNLRLDLKCTNLQDFDVLVVEDILDSGNTLSCILKYLKSKGAQSVRLCTLLNKPERRKVDVPIDFEGISIPDEFVVGYGLDYNEQYRQLPFIGVLDPAVYSN